jgi:hypothetical protein
MAATTHMMIFELLMDEIAPASGVRLSCSIWGVVSTVSPAGTRDGMPRVTTAVMSGLPPRARAWASRRGMKMIGEPASIVRFTTWPTTRNDIEPTVIWLPTAAPVRVSATTWPDPDSARPDVTAGSPIFPGSTPNTKTVLLWPFICATCWGKTASPAALATPGD